MKYIEIGPPPVSKAFLFVEEFFQIGVGKVRKRKSIYPKDKVQTVKK